MCTLHEDLCTFMVISRRTLLRMRNISDKICREDWNTRFTIYNYCLISCRLWDNEEKYGRTMQATDGDTAHALCMLDVQSYRHILRIRNTYFFSTAALVTLMQLSVTLYIVCLSRLKKSNEMQQYSDSNLAVNKYLHTVASRWISST